MTVQTRSSRGRRLLPAPMASGAAIVMVVAAGCSSKGVTLRDPTGLETCAVVSGATTVTIPVEDLSQHSECDLDGVTLVYPTGDEWLVEAPGVNASGDAKDGSVIGWTNWGRDGVTAWWQTPDGVTFWGTPAGIQLSLRSRAMNGPEEGSTPLPGRES